MVAHLFSLVFVCFSLGMSVVSTPSLLGTLGSAAGVIGGAVVAGEAYCMSVVSYRVGFLSGLLARFATLRSLLEAGGSTLNS